MLNTSTTKFLIGQVVETDDPTQFQRITDQNGNAFPPGTIRVRLGNSYAHTTEVYAAPANLNDMTVPLYGEQVLLLQATVGTADSRTDSAYYYVDTLSVHNIVNNGIMPWIQDVETSNRQTQNRSLSSTRKAKKPSQISFTERDILPIMPLQGDRIHQSRFGSAIRMSSTHTNLSKYAKRPPWTGNPGDPIVAITNGIKETTSPGGYYAIEDLDKDSSYIYLTSTQKVTARLAHSRLGKKVRPLASYNKGQVIIGSDRLVFNARLDEIILVAKKDVKIVTPNWQSDMDEFFTIMRDTLEVLNKLSSGTFKYATPSGPTGPSDALPEVKKLVTRLKQMEQR